MRVRTSDLFTQAIHLLFFAEDKKPEPEANGAKRQLNSSWGNTICDNACRQTAGLRYVSTL